MKEEERSVHQPHIKEEYLHHSAFCSFKTKIKIMAGQQIRQGKTDPQVNATTSYDYSDYESAPYNQQPSSYLNRNEMPVNLMDRFRCEMENVYLHDLEYTLCTYEFELLIFHM